MIHPRCYAPDGETSTAVSTSHADEGLGSESRIGQIGMQAHKNTLDRFQVGSVKHRARHLKRINGLAGGKGKSKVAQRIAFIVVHNRIREVYCIGRIGTQRVQQFHLHTFAARLHLRRLNLRRGDDNLLIGILQLHELIKRERDFLLLVVCGIQLRRAFQQHGRIFIIRSTVRCADAGTGINHQGKQDAGHPSHLAQVLSSFLVHVG